jgi:energy-coupling factor transporter ATP-binding protein EcfA2
VVVADGRPLVGVPPMITDMKLELMAGECALLLGANGAGKTTLLKILGGYHMIPKHMVQVLGAPPFHETKLTMSGDLSYIGGTWSVRALRSHYSISRRGCGADSQAGCAVTRITRIKECALRSKRTSLGATTRFGSRAGASAPACQCTFGALASSGNKRSPAARCIHGPLP